MQSEKVLIRLSPNPSVCALSALSSVKQFQVKPQPFMESMNRLHKKPAQSPGDRRRDYRTILDVTAGLFLGSREADWFCFDYGIVDLGSYGLQIKRNRDKENEIAHWLSTNDTIFLQIGFGNDRVIFDQGIIVWIIEDDEKGVQVCGVEGRPEVRFQYNVWFSTATSDLHIDESLFNSAETLFLNIMEDCAEAKKELSVVLDSLSEPVSNMPEKIRLAAIGQGIKVRQEAERLDVYCHQIKNGMTLDEQITSGMSPDELLLLLKSNIYYDLSRSCNILPENLPAFRNIRQLEGAMRCGHNTIVLLRESYLSYVYKSM